MTEIRLVAAHANGVSAVEYCNLVGQIQGQTSDTAFNCEHTVRVAGTLSHGQVIVYSSSSGGGTLKSRINGADGNISVSISTGTTGIFEDNTNTDSVSAGDEVASEIDENAGGSFSISSPSFVWEADTNTYNLLISAGQNGINDNETNYFSMLSFIAEFSTESPAQMEILHAGTLKDGFVQIDSNNVGTSTLTSRIGGADGNISISITASTTGRFEDTSNTDSVSDGNLINWKIVTGSGGSNLGMTVASVGFETTDNEFMLGGCQQDTIVDNDTYWYAISGNSWQPRTASEDEVSITSRMANATVKELLIEVTTNSVTNASTLSIRKNQTDALLSVSVTGSTTGTFNTTGSEDIAEDDEINYQFVLPLGGTSMVYQQITSLWDGSSGTTEQTKTFTIDIVLKKESLIKTFTMDIVIQKPSLTKTFTMDIVLQKSSLTKTFTMDIILQKELIKTFTMDIVIQKELTKTFTMDIVLVTSGTPTKTFTMDIVIQKPSLTKTFTMDIILQKELTKTFTMDIVIQKPSLTKTFTMDIVIQKPSLTKTFTMDIVIQKPSLTKTFTMDIILQKELIKTFTMDIVLEKELTKTFTMDIVLQKELIKTFTMDIVIQKPSLTKTFTMDIVLLPFGANIKTFTMDIILQKLGLIQTFTMDIVLRVRVRQILSLKSKSGTLNLKAKSGTIKGEGTTSEVII